MTGTFEGLKELPGVTAVIVCDHGGIPLAPVDRDAFPGGSEEAMADLLAALEVETGEVTTATLSFGTGKMIIKRVSTGYIGIRCDGPINMKMLDLSLALAEKKRGAKQRTEPLPRQQPAEKRNFLQVTVIEKTAGTYWESMKQAVSVTEATAHDIRSLYQTADFRKLRITNTATGKRKSFPVRIIRNGQDDRHDGRLFMTVAAAESLGVAKGDHVAAEPATGEGIFGWEGI